MHNGLAQTGLVEFSTAQINRKPWLLFSPGIPGLRTRFESPKLIPVCQENYLLPCPSNI
jgi:hypothetical protein